MVCIRCPKCQKLLQIDEGHIGVLACPSCTSRFRISQPKPAAPAPSLQAPPALAAAPPQPPAEEEPLTVEEAEEIDEIEEVDEIPTLSSTPEAFREAVEEAPARKRFKVRDYQPDGGFSFIGIVLIFSIEILAGLILGFAGSFIGQFFNLVILFPLCIGFLLGTAGIPGIRLGKVPILGWAAWPAWWAAAWP